MRRAFTLIELMIVIAILAILAVIAFPNLMKAQKQANEANAVAALRDYMQAQDRFQKAGYFRQGRATLYAARLDHLYELPPAVDASGVPPGVTDVAKVERPIQLVSRDLARATTRDAALAGYVFLVPPLAHVPADGTDGAGTPVNYGTSFELFATPAEHGSTGDYTYFINRTGEIRRRDFGQTVNPATGIPPSERPFSDEPGNPWSGV